MAGSPDRGIGRMAIRPVASIDELHACEDLQREAWGFADLDVIPLTQLVAAQKAGGIVLGGFNEAGEMLGFCYGFLGRAPDDRLLHYSHMLAVAKRARAAGLGARLKWAQRQAVLEQGFDLMAWTYDPLESLNGYFNFQKLGVVASAYLQNVYGETSSSLHRGTPTDRLFVEWHLDSQRVEERSRGVGSPSSVGAAVEELPAALSARYDDGLAVPSDPDLELTGPRLSCEIPVSIQTVKERDPETALAWRMATRAVLGGYLGRGYEVRECIRSTGSQKRTRYVLSRR